MILINSWFCFAQVVQKFIDKYPDQDKCFEKANIHDLLDDIESFVHLQKMLTKVDQDKVLDDNIFLAIKRAYVSPFRLLP